MTKLTILLLCILTYSCSPVIKENSYFHKWTIEVKYLDNTKDTFTGINYGVPQLTSEGVVYVPLQYNIATHAKTIKLLKDTIIIE